jgi:uncharacterized protein (DUF885 family)
VSSPFPDFATTTLASWLDRQPVEATLLGAHDYDARLDDPSPEAAAARAARVREQLTELDGVATVGVEEDVDAQVLRTALRTELLELEHLHEAEWDAMTHNPGTALYSLVSRPFAPAAQRLDAARARLSAVPTFLAAARARLGTLSRIHAETAIMQLGGTLGLIDTALPELAAEADGSLGADAERAHAAVEEHRAWLRDRLVNATHSARIGPDLFRAKLALTLDTDFEPDGLLARAEDDLDRIGAEIAAEAGRFAGVADPDAGTVRQVLDELAREVATDDTILDVCRAALIEMTTFVRDRDLLTVYDDPVEVIEMPEIDRGIAGAYCNPSGPLETAPLPTQFAVSPTPEGWSEQRIASYFREYNLHMLQNLTVHEAMPGHALQLMHSNRHRATTPIRAVFGSGSFIEGWAVYAEELMARSGYRRDVSERAASALRMQQLKMQLRTTLNTILDIRFHCHELDEADAMRLMLERGFQEEGESAEKWQRVQLTSTQLCTYYVGYCEVRDLAQELRTARPGQSERDLHDAILGHGSPPVRHLRTLLLGR